MTFQTDGLFFFINIFLISVAKTELPFLNCQDAFRAPTGRAPAAIEENSALWLHVSGADAEQGSQGHRCSAASGVKTHLMAAGGRQSHITITTTHRCVMRGWSHLPQTI